METSVYSNRRIFAFEQSIIGKIFGDYSTSSHTQILLHYLYAHLRKRHPFLMNRCFLKLNGIFCRCKIYHSNPVFSNFLLKKQHYFRKAASSFFNFSAKALLEMADFCCHKPNSNSVKSGFNSRSRPVVQRLSSSNFAFLTAL